MTSDSVPISSTERIFLLDVIRGFALCGILILNIYFFGRPEPAWFNLNAYHETGQANVITWYITNFLVEGSYRALFSMLFGAGCILLISRLEKKEGGLQPADIYYRRLFWMLLFGLVDAFIFLWPGDILYSYAVCGLLIFPLRKASVRLLLLIVILLISITMLKNWVKVTERVGIINKGSTALSLQNEKKILTEGQQEDLKKFTEFKDKRSPLSIRKDGDKEIAEYHKSWLSLMYYLAPINKKIESVIFYDNLVFDVLIFIVLGMAMFKLGVLTGERPAWLYGIFVIAGYTLGLGSGLQIGHSWRVVNFDYLEFLKLHPNRFDTYQLHRVLVAFGNLGVIVLLWKSHLVDGILKLFGNLGQMAFTNYLMQSVLCGFIFSGYGLGYFGQFERYELWYFVAGIWIFQLIFSTLWLRYFLFGPLEWVWRTLTYWQRQPFKKPTA